MKRLLPVLFISLFFVACQKEDDKQVAEPPLAAQSIADVSYGSDAAQRMDVFLPAGRTDTGTKAIVVIHGGGWISGDKGDMNQYLPIIKQQLSDYAIFNINYRLGSVITPFPAQENDVKAALTFILNKAGEYKFNTAKTVLLGASAGGHLALLQAYKQTSPKVKAVVSLFGPTDMPALYQSYGAGSLPQQALQILLTGTPATNTALYQSSSPVNFVNAQNPPTLLLHGTADPIVPITQSIALRTMLETNGASVKMVTYNGAGHGDWDDATFANAFAEIVNFIKAKNP